MAAAASAVVASQIRSDTTHSGREPTPEENNFFGDLGDVLDWARIPGDLHPLSRCGFIVDSTMATVTEKQVVELE